ncbi:lipopolysaccharide biosynthesis protein [Falsiporphyromonas endometrii]|uniref:Lipopolysaccharide biosynthesis protein n=1 Tax=Falsiporphyromonas endometrii TaxID=1387297 RepID=A0ABV9K7J4_9PORP
MNSVATSRSRNSLRNAKYGAVFYVLILISTFFFRRYFIQALGVDLLGVNATVQNLLGFLNVAELGLASAVAFALYKPLYESDQEQIKDIVSIQGWFYRYIAIFVSLGSIVLLFYFPQIFQKTKLPIWYAYSTYGVMLYGTLLSYLFNYRQVIFTSDQRDYRVTLAVQAPKLIKMVLQTLCLYLNVPNAYIWWLVLEFVASSLTTILIEIFLRRDYPWLSTSVRRGLCKRKDYPVIMKKTGQLIFHKISAFALFQLSPLLLYYFTNADMVAIYTNYVVIMNGVVAVVDTPFRGITGSVGNLVASGNHKRSEEVFVRLYFFRLWVVLLVIGVLYTVANMFVSLWVGPDLVLGKWPFLLWLLYTLISSMRLQDVFISAYGLYHDIWAPVAEMIINLVLSFWLGTYWGLSGILTGACISVFSIATIWRLIFLYRRGFGFSFFPFIFKVLSFFSINIVALGMGTYLVNRIFMGMMSHATLGNFLMVSGATVFILSLLTFGINMILSKTFRTVIISLQKKLIGRVH